MRQPRPDVPDVVAVRVPRVALGVGSPGVGRIAQAQPDNLQHLAQSSGKRFGGGVVAAVTDGRRVVGEEVRGVPIQRNQVWLLKQATTNGPKIKQKKYKLKVKFQEKNTKNQQFIKIKKFNRKIQNLKAKFNEKN